MYCYVTAYSQVPPRCLQVAEVDFCRRCAGSQTFNLSRQVPRLAFTHRQRLSRGLSIEAGELACESPTTPSVGLSSRLILWKPAQVSPGHMMLRTHFIRWASTKVEGATGDLGTLPNVAIRIDFKIGSPFPPSP